MLIPIIEELLNRTIAHDENAPAKINKLSGSVIKFSITGPEITLYLCFTGEHISIQTQFQKADATVTGSPVALAKMFLSNDPAKSLFDGAVSIEGERHLVQQFNDIISSLDIDWQEELAKKTSDQFSHLTTRGLSNATNWYSQTSESLHADIEEYLQEETRSVPRRNEVNHFIDGVHQLRDGIARIEARLNRLKDSQA